ncbi:transcriptional regulator GcvA [Vibrio profundum]|uniref:transcriptional regulator GcvA n=1 Tax=Vibrio profundum TaxID=2910247 RepID=UPI003D09A7B0
MMRPIHLNALRAFEASARHQSFSLAAKELNVTPAAVGQLVRSLEDWLDAPLFIRTTSGKSRLQITDSAERALPDIRAGLDKLASGLERLQESVVGGVLTVTLSPAFAAKWLLPKLDRFQVQCENTDVRLDMSLSSVDFVARKIDIGIRYGLGQWPNLKAEKLLEEEVYPVCSPQFLANHPNLQQASSLMKTNLLHDLSMEGYSGFPSWSMWLKMAGVSQETLVPSIQINNSAAVLQAAMEGHGVALARSVMAKDDLKAGRLVRLFPDIHLTSPLAYYVVYRPEYADIEKVTSFRDWLFVEAR